MGWSHLIMQRIGLFPCSYLGRILLQTVALPPPVDKQKNGLQVYKCLTHSGVMAGFYCCFKNLMMQRELDLFIVRGEKLESN